MKHYRCGVGEALVVEGPALLETILGSCVAAVFWDERLHLGAMCHGALPRCPPQIRNRGDIQAALRYVDFAVQHLAEQLQRRGANLDRLQVKLFGGADVLDLSSSAPPTIGSQNRDSALGAIESIPLRVTASDMGGICARVVYFDTESGEVLVKRLHRVAATRASS